MRDKHTIGKSRGERRVIFSSSGAIQTIWERRSLEVTEQKWWVQERGERKLLKLIWFPKPLKDEEVDTFEVEFNGRTEDTATVVETDIQSDAIVIENWSFILISLQWRRE